METKFTYDWLSATLDPKNTGYLGKALPLGNPVAVPTMRPRFGYDSVAQYDSGAVMMWSTSREDMGVHIMLSGSTLREFATRGSNSLQVLTQLKRFGARVSRIDLAIDVFGSEMTCGNLCKPNRQPYKGKGRTPKFTQVGDIEDGWTIYIGSRSSDKFLRIYDKSKESGFEDSSWVRIEVECKGMVAHWLGDTLPSYTAQEAYELSATLVKTMVDFNVRDWSDALDCKSVEISIPKKTDKDTLGWLIKSCAPALAKEIAKRPQDDVIGQFWDALRGELYGLGINTE